MDVMAMSRGVPSLGKVLLVDDHALFRRGFASLMASRVNMEAVEEASNGFEAIEKARELKPDLILMDIAMPGCNGIEATKAISAEMPEVVIVMLTVSDDDESIFESIKSGARGYLLKNLDPDELFILLDGLTRGEAPISRSLATRILHKFAEQAQQESQAQLQKIELTHRERDVLQLLTEGATNRQIAASLQITENTVKNHLRSVLEKLRVQNRVQAAAYALRQGLVERKSPGKEDGNR